MGDAVSSGWIDGVAFLGTIKYRIQNLRVCGLQLFVTDPDASMVCCAGDAEKVIRQVSVQQCQEF
jgi:hypothetical protein